MLSKLVVFLVFWFVYIILGIVCGVGVFWVVIDFGLWDIKIDIFYNICIKGVFIFGLDLF